MRLLYSSFGKYCICTDDEDREVLPAELEAIVFFEKVTDRYVGNT